MSLYLLALLIGVVAGLRAMTAPAAVSWAAHLGWLPLQHTPIAFLGATVTPYILTVLAIGELITDQLIEERWSPCVSPLEHLDVLPEFQLESYNRLHLLELRYKHPGRAHETSGSLLRTKQARQDRNGRDCFEKLTHRSDLVAESLVPG